MANIIITPNTEGRPFRHQAPGIFFSSVHNYLSHHHFINFTHTGSSSPTFQMKKKKKNNNSTLGCFCICTGGQTGKALFCGFSSKQSNSRLWVLTILPHCLPNSILRQARYISGPPNAYNLRQGWGANSFWKVYAQLLAVSGSLWPHGLWPQGSAVHGLFQARILEWVDISSSRESSWLKDWTQVSCVSCAGRPLTLSHLGSHFL